MVLALLLVLASSNAFGATDQGVNFNSSVNPIYATPGLMDFTSPSAPTFVPPGSRVLGGTEPPLMGSDISQSPTLLDDGSGGASPPPGAPVGGMIYPPYSNSDSRPNRPQSPPVNNAPAAE